MNETELRERVIGVLRRIAPEVDPSSVDSGESLRRQADLDSVDVMNFVVGLHEELGVDVPETDYAELETLDGAVSYLSRRLDAPSGE
ncbi:MAG: acyl carrier protein [Gemmatimonadetes bacterium]|nr:acyl carrier protein [Gemmatimonadota bacterium]NIR81256.1 acyl carrier protein [Gemmatimonadota bacterium]NIT90099.1 acyl carrier protein [Gemmatimonadota bacterium]NIU33918.1 acyl carrier protein [Gemmatimonadota bacterium]NIU38097.1 acyl carrier protein [Gemmatimonadota bacterium]